MAVKILDPIPGSQCVAYARLARGLAARNSEVSNLHLTRRVHYPTASMPLRRRNVALLVAMGVLFVVLFPASVGPFTATNGPVTALRALAFAVLLFAAMSFLNKVMVADSFAGLTRVIETRKFVVFDFSSASCLRC